MADDGKFAFKGPEMSRRSFLKNGAARVVTNPTKYAQGLFEEGASEALPRGWGTAIKSAHHARQLVNHLKDLGYDSFHHIVEHAAPGDVSHTVFARHPTDKSLSSHTEANMFKGGKFHPDWDEY